MKEKIKQNKTIILLILIIIIQLAAKIYVDFGKEDFFIDEIYSYGLMNYKQAFIFEEPTFMNHWHSKEYFDEYLIISEDEATNLAPVYNNQMEDYHPPFYYLLLRIASSFTIGSFTKWTGLILNLIIFVACDIMVYFIGKILFRNKNYALLLVTFYGFSKFSMENTLFIRMYQLLELQMLLLAHWGLKNYYQKDLKLKEIFKFIILVVLGTLTHYYFIIFLIGISIIFIIKYLRKKQFKNLAKFIIAFAIAQILIALIFPAYTNQLMGNTDRSSNKILTPEGRWILYAEREKEYLEVLDNNMFNIKISYIMIAIVVLAIVLLVINLIKNGKKKVRFKINRRINIILIPTIFYWLVISLTSPYIDVRYILPICVFILISIMFILKKELQMIIKNKKIVLILMLIICICYINPLWGNKELQYQYKGSKEKIENIEKYKDIPCIYIYRPADVLKNTFNYDINYVRQFENVYIMEDTKFTTQEVEKALEGIDISEGIIIMGRDNKITLMIQEVVQELEDFNNYKKIEDITTERKIPTGVYWLY